MRACGVRNGGVYGEGCRVFFPDGYVVNGEAAKAWGNGGLWVHT